MGLISRLPSALLFGQGMVGGGKIIDFHLQPVHGRHLSMTFSNWIVQLETHTCSDSGQALILSWRWSFLFPQAHFYL